jgi:DNA primase
MVDTISLKKLIHKENKVEYILQEIGCHHIKYHFVKEYYTCGNYNGDNPNSITVKNNEYINVVNYTRQSEFPENSDIITLVQYNKQCSFIDAVKYLHSLLGLEYKYQKKPEKKEEKFDPLSIFKNIRNRRRNGTVNVEDIQFLNEDILNDYVPLLYIDWFRDGITERTRRKFGLCYSYKQKRVVIPMRYWLTGELMGTNARTTVENYKELNILKYFITPTYQKSLNLYGLYENYDSIQKAGYVVVAESERSVLKRDSLNDSTLVALSGHTLSEEQIRILIGLNVEIVIALDKDIDINEVRFMCEKFYHIRQVSYIHDVWDLLGEKDAPMDANNKTYNFLFKYRVKYDESEHQKYLKSLEKK